MIEYRFEEQPLYAIADIHGSFTALERGIKETQISNCVILICGDIGLGFRRKDSHLAQMKYINDVLKTHNIMCLCLRGNHDDPYYFKGGVDLSNFKAIDDYSVISIGNKHVLCVGGAISIDRKYRKQVHQNDLKWYGEIFPNKSESELEEYAVGNYWASEEPFFNESKLMEITASGIKINHIATHTSPPFAFKNSKKGIEHWMQEDDELEEDLRNEREVFLKIYNKVREDGHPIETWTYGHFHEHHVEIIDGIKFTALENADYKFDMIEIR